MDKHITIPRARLTELETAERERDELRELLNQSPARSTALSGAKGLNVTENVREAFAKLCEMCVALGAAPLNKHRGCWEHQIDEQWSIAVNGQPAPVLSGDGVDAWLPIATAPKDRTEVILFAPDEDPSVFTAMYIGHWCRSSSGQYKPNNDLYGDREIKAVAWMPMPAPPANA